jgi:hypothetical protein
VVRSLTVGFVSVAITIVAVAASPTFTSATTAFGTAGAWSDRIVSTATAGAPFEGATSFQAVAISADGETIAYLTPNGSAYGALLVMNLASGTSRVLGNAQPGPIALSNDGTRVAYSRAFSGATVEVVATGTALISSTGASLMTLSGDGHRTVYIDLGTKELWYRDDGGLSGHLVPTPSGGSISDSSATGFLSSTGSTLYLNTTASLDPAESKNGGRHAYKIDLDTGVVVREFSGPNALASNFMSLSHNGRWAIERRWTGADFGPGHFEATTYRVDLTGATPDLPLPTLAGYDATPMSMAISDDGRYTVGGGSAFSITDLERGTSTKLARAGFVAMAATGRRVALASNGRAGFPNEIAIDESVDVPTFVSTSPMRILETRSDYPQINYSGPSPRAGAVVQLRATGTFTTGATSFTVPDTAGAVAFTVTATHSLSDGYVTVYPCGGSPPNASNLNVRPGHTIANLVIVPPGADHRVCLYTFGSTDLIADLVGYWPKGSRFTSLNPERLLETRPDYGQRGYAGPTPGPGTTIELGVIGVGQANLPADASAVAVNVTGTQNLANGYLTVYPCGEPVPTASNVSLAASGTNSTVAFSRVGAGGKICIYTYGGGDIVADIVGWWPADSDYTPLSPTRRLDTRTLTITGYVPFRQPAAGESVPIDFAWWRLSPPPALTTTVAIAVTATNARRDGYVSAYPCGEAPPNASNLNLSAGETVSDLVISRVGTNGRVCLYTSAGADLIADVVGFWPV